MADLKKPWEATSATADVKPLYSPARKMSLSEANISPESAYRFTIGSILAWSHAVGVFHTDLHSEHVPFSPLTGLPTFLDTNASFGETSAGRAVSDFVTPFLSFSSDDLYAILIGYVNGVYSAIASSNEYADEFLQRIGVEPVFDPRPRAVAIDVDQWLAWLGIDIGFADHAFCLIDSSDGRSRRIWDNPEDFCAIVTALLLLGIDCRFLSDLEIPRDRSETAHAVGELLVSLYKKGESSSGALRGLNLVEHQLTTKFVAAVRTLNAQSAKPETADIVQAFFASLKESRTSSIVPFLNKLADIFDFFAVLADDPVELVEWRQTLSLGAAQLSCMLLNCPAETLAEDEIRCNTLIQRHNWLSSVRELFNEFKTCVTALHRATYTNSRASAFLSVFERSCGDANRNALCSLRWRGMTLNRRSLQLVNMLAKRLPELSDPHRSGLANLGMTFAARANKSLQFIPPIQMISSGKVVQELILAELEATGALYKQVKEKGIDHPKTLTMLNDIAVGYASSDYRLDGSRISIRNLWE
jgi:hypothetical protein